MNKQQLIKVIDLLSEANLVISEMAVELTEQPFDLLNSKTWDLPAQMDSLKNLSESGVVICKELEKFTDLLIDDTKNKNS